jgi:hypothetical protein
MVAVRLSDGSRSVVVPARVRHELHDEINLGRLDLLRDFRGAAREELSALKY